MWVASLEGKASIVPGVMPERCFGGVSKASLRIRHATRIPQSFFLLDPRHLSNWGWTLRIRTAGFPFINSAIRKNSDHCASSVIDFFLVLAFSSLSISSMASPSARVPQPSAGADVALRHQLEIIFDEELAGVVGPLQQARYQTLGVVEARMKEVLTALGAAEAALANAQAELQAGREKMREMTAAAEVAAARIVGLKGTVGLQAARIRCLEDKLQDQVAYSEKLGARAARIPKLEGRIAELVAVEAEFLKAARRVPRTGPSN